MDNVFEEIQPLLIEEIPRTLGAATPDAEICVVRIFYYDTHAPSAYVDFRCVTTEQRKATLERHRDNGLMYLWGSGEECGNRPRVTIPADDPADENGRKIAVLFTRIYSLLCNDEMQNMQHYRSAIQKAALAMNRNGVTWGFPISDDFVIVPADGSMCFCDDASDIVASVPEPKIKLLQSKGFLGPNGRLAGGA